MPAVQKAGKQTDKSIIGIVGGLTTSEQPTFWFYVPYTQDLPNLRSEFILQDSLGKDVYRNAIVLPPKPGIIGIPPSNTAVQTFRFWAVAIILLLGHLIFSVLEVWE